MLLSFTNQGDCCVIELKDELRQNFECFLYSRRHYTSKDSNMIIDQTTTIIYPIPFDVICKLPSYILASNHQNYIDKKKKNALNKTPIMQIPGTKR